MTSGRVLFTAAREAVRAIASPLWLLPYLFARGYWKERTGAALAAPLPELENLETETPIAQSELHLFISAGEISGERLALRLMKAVATQGQPVRWSCFGGQSMADSGADLLHSLSDQAVMGFVAVLRHLPGICQAFDRYERLLREDPPDLVILVDYPGFHLVLAEAARRRGIPVMHYVAPQYWAWAPWRMRRYRRAMNRTLTILPFEVKFFDDAGIRCTYVGHPLLDEVKENAPSEREREELRARPTLCLLPGSRSREIQQILPGMLTVAAKLREGTPDLRVVIPHREQRRADLVHEILSDHNAGFAEVHVGPPGRWLAGSRVVLAKSGTGSLEACLHGTPTVVVYKLGHRLVRWLYTRLLSVPYIASANLICGHRIVSEFCIAHDDEWNQVAEAVRELWHDGETRDRALLGLSVLRERLGRSGASDRAAHAVRAFLSVITQKQVALA